MLAPEGYFNPDVLNTVRTVKMDITKGQLLRNINTHTMNGRRGVVSWSKLKIDEYPLRERHAVVDVLQQAFGSN